MSSSEQPGGAPTPAKIDEKAKADEKKSATKQAEPTKADEKAKADEAAKKAEVPKADEKKPESAPVEKKPEAKKEPDKKPEAKKPKDPSLSDAKELHKTSVSDEVVIRFDHVTKTYNLYKNDRGRFLGIFNYQKKSTLLGTVHANNDLSFEIRKGEAVAFVGRNGAGKSTALKMVTGVTHPTSGTVEVKGRVSALLELQAGFDQQLTGRENIALRGQIIGLSKQQIAQIEPEVIEFAELGLYIDQPLRTYSSGMKARLGFAFAVAIDPEILVVDETLSVGDKAFQKKCINRIREIMMNENVTVLFVTHSSTTAKEFCSRGIVLHEGTKVFDGSIEEASAYYEKHYAG